jgi:hypothetical protein
MGPAYGGGPGLYPGAQLPPPAPDGAHAARPAAVPIKPEPGSSHGRDRSGPKVDKDRFLSQPMHGYVSGRDLAIVPAGHHWQPLCGCRNNAAFAGAPPGPHATWDCPLRYIEKCGYCPGFRADGTKDPAQWAPGGDVLTRATRDAWLTLIEQHHLPLPRDAGARAPDFRK